MINNTNITDMINEEENPFNFSLNSMPTNIALIITFTIMISWIILGNLTVILAVKKTAALRACLSNVLVANLALSDLLLGLTVLPLSAMVEVFGYWPLAREVCYFWLVVGMYVFYKELIVKRIEELV